LMVRAEKHAMMRIPFGTKGIHGIRRTLQGP
jgi:hypothetical protein